VEGVRICNQLLMHCHCERSAEGGERGNPTLQIRDCCAVLLLAMTLFNSLKIMTTLFCKIPPILPFPKGGIIPLFGKEGQGEIF
jgi:hypothetical protein